MAFGKEFTSEDFEILALNQNNRVPLRETAKLLGRSEAATKSLASDHGLLQPRKGKWTKKEDAELIYYVKLGLSVSDIKQKIGREGISQRLARLGLTFESVYQAK